MKEQLDRIDSKLEEARKHLSSIDITLAIQQEVLESQAEVLKDHTKRSASNEKRLFHLELGWEKHLAKVEGVLTTFKWSVIISGGVWSVLQIINFIGNGNGW